MEIGKILSYDKRRTFYDGDYHAEHPMVAENTVRENEFNRAGEFISNFGKEDLDKQ
jgi:hypothetical protein